jgi:hypothetical protein
MKFPKYWAKETHQVTNPEGKTISFGCWRWSDASHAEARQWAKTSAQEIAWKIADKQKLDRYSYGERPLREEVVQVVKDGGNRELAIVTRNAYGALVLNAANAMFIDIDFQDGGIGSVVTKVRKLFDKTVLTEEDKHIQSVEQWAQGYPDLGIRIYRTYGGLRCLVVNYVFDPTQESTMGMLQSLNSDPLYIKLCRRQECFRARLTPKPWRCGGDKPPSRYPWEDSESERRYRRWEEDYKRISSEYTVCRLVKQIGRNELHPDIQPVLSVHDQMSCTDPDLELA